MSQHAEGYSCLSAPLRAEVLLRPPFVCIWSRSAVGKASRSREQRLGVRLFPAHHPQPEATDNGLRPFYGTLSACALEEIPGGIRCWNQKQQVSGRLRVAMPVLFGRQCVALLIGTGAGTPGLELEMSFSDRVVDLVEEGFDMAVRNGTLQDSSVLWSPESWERHRHGAVRRAGLPAEEGPATEALMDLPHHAAINYLQAGRVLHPAADG